MITYDDYDYEPIESNSPHDHEPPDNEDTPPCKQDGGCGDPYCRKCGVMTWSDFRP